MERYIVTSNTNRDVAKTAINVKQLIQKLRTFASKRIVLMLATCYTGSPQSKSQTKPGQKGNFRKQVKPLQAPALQVLSAAGFAQAAYESTKLRSDVYTHFFLDCLRKLAKQKKRLSTIAIHACATQPTTQFVRKHQREIQVPRVDSQLGANRDILLFHHARKQTRTGYFWAGKRRNNVTFVLKRKDMNAKGTPVPATMAEPGEYIRLRPGRYTVIVRNQIGMELKRYTITIISHRLTSIRAENEPTDREKLREMKQGSSILFPVGYTLSALLLLTGGGLLLHSHITGDKLSLYIGGTYGGIGLVWICILGMLHIANRSDIKRMELEAKYDIPSAHQPNLFGRTQPTTHSIRLYQAGH
jgi:hypothetical protein